MGEGFRSPSIRPGRPLRPLFAWKASFRARFVRGWLRVRCNCYHRGMDTNETNLEDAANASRLKTAAPAAVADPEPRARRLAPARAVWCWAHGVGYHGGVHLPKLDDRRVAGGHARVRHQRKLRPAAYHGVHLRFGPDQRHDGLSDEPVRFQEAVLRVHGVVRRRVRCGHLRAELSVPAGGAPDCGRRRRASACRLCSWWR